MRIVIISIIILFVLFLILWLGLTIKPKSFPSLAASKLSGNSIAVPDSLPEPVKVFYSQVYESGIPVIETAIISGRAKMRISGITFPARFRFSHKAGTSYHHNIELTFFGLPVMKVNEYYKDGKARLELPFGTIENEPKVNQGANLALWGEAIWYSSAFLTDPRVHWKPIDDETARLVVPFGEKFQQIIVRFDPESGMPQLLEAMRYKQADDVYKTLWIIETKDWKSLNGHMACTAAAITWFDEGNPWAVFDVEEIKYNLNTDDVSAQVK